MDERVEIFQTTLKPGISYALIDREYTDFKTLLDDARRIEARRKELAHTFSKDKDDRDKKSKNDRSSVNTRTVTQTISTDSTSQKKPSFEKPNGVHPNAKFGPVSKKPEGWIGRWFDGESDPPKLTAEDREQLSKQRRCWSCRGSGHKGGDPVCINHNRQKRFNMTTTKNPGTPDTSDTESDSEKA
jgi:hypothetical protein